MMNEATEAGFVVPRSIVWAVLLLLPSMLITGTTYVVSSRTTIGEMSDKLTKLETRADTLATADRVAKLEARADTLAAAERVAKLEARLEVASQAAELSRSAIIEMVQAGNLKLTRMEAQLGFIVGTYVPLTPPAAVTRK